MGGWSTPAPFSCSISEPAIYSSLGNNGIGFPLIDWTGINSVTMSVDWR
jgi:hypothetical protein